MKKVFWNGNGLSMLSDIERELAEHGDVCAAGTVTAVGSQIWLDGKHVIGTIADPDEEGAPEKLPLSERIRLAQGGAPKAKSASELQFELEAMRRQLDDARQLNDRVMQQRDRAIQAMQAQKPAPGQIDPTVKPPQGS